MDKKELTTEEKQALWRQIHLNKACPSCKAKDSMLAGPRGGLAINIKCSACGQKYWTSPYMGFGAEPI